MGKGKGRGRGKGGGKGGGFGKGSGGRGGKGGGGNRAYRRDFREPREDKWKQRKTADGEDEKPLDLSTATNPGMEEYYKAQKICKDDADWDAMIASMRTPLPISFRINGGGKLATFVRDEMKRNVFGGLQGDALVVDGEQLRPPVSVPWYPNELAWQMSYSRAQLRKHAPLAGVFEFLKSANDYGSITRQEVVSMVPPLMLDVKPNHRVLDMCAAPGSKTFQLIEGIHAESGAHELPEGVVVANDADFKRCNLLVHQTKRAQSPSLIVTNHEAQLFPVLRKGKYQPAQLFDRILCDVPCSGDGTIRKAPDLWRKWNLGSAMGLHKLQVQIAIHAGKLLKVGGRLVYSTCSLNPIENEAVVAEILRQTGGALVLQDVSTTLPELKRNPGLKTWLVKDKHGWQDNELEEEGKEKAIYLCKSMFPQDDIKDMPLERCVRILPHLMDTGGFFVAVFDKVSLVPGDFGVVKEAPAEEATAAKGGGEGSGGGQGGDGDKGYVRKGGIDPIIFVNDDEISDNIRSFYGLPDKFPLKDRLLTRSTEGERPKRLYYVSPAVQEMTDNDQRRALRITSTGLKAFERQENRDPSLSCSYRVTQEALHIVLPFITKQRAEITLEEYRRLLFYRNVSTDPKWGPKALMEQSSADAIAELASGCVILTPRVEEGDLTSVASVDELVIACWKGKSSVGLLVTKVESANLLTRIGGRKDLPDFDKVPQAPKHGEAEADAAEPEVD